MNRHALTLSTTALMASLVAGCAQSPLPVAGNFDQTLQKKVRSSGHWQVVAGDAARETLKLLAATGRSADEPVYLVPAPSPAPFEKALHGLLTTELVKTGRPVVVKPQGALLMKYEVQVVEHKSARPYLTPGVLTLLGAGVGVVYGLMDQDGGARMLGVGGAIAGADYLGSTYAGGPTHHEIIVATSVQAGDRILVRKTDVYYIEDADVGLFKLPADIRNIPVVNR